MMLAKFAAVVIMGYLIGSIPIGYLLTRRQAKVDVTAYGSGKMGATNVLRTAGGKSAALVAGMDILKGVLAVVLAGLIVGKGYLVVGNFGFGTLVAQVLAALAAVVGHNWSVFLKFKGGRGVATFFGGLVALCPIAAIVGGEIIVIGAGLTQYVSLGSIAGVVGAYAILVPLTIMNGFPVEYLFYTLVGSVIIIVMHRDNISRLMAGKERRLGEKGEKRDSSASSPTEGVK
jgi:glycerol-3-phosphate acyltransferase PlsY